MNNSISFKATLLAIPALLSGCGGDSEDYKTSELTASYEVTAQVETTNLEASFSVGAGFQSKQIKLTDGDQIVAISNGQTIELNRSERDYRAQLSTDSIGSDITFSLLREKQSNAPASTVIMPVPLSISAPATDATFNSQDSVSIVWTPGNESDSIPIFFSFDCPDDSDSLLRVNNINTPDTGSVTISVAELLESRINLPDPTPGVTCALNINISRTSYGSMDEMLSGSISAQTEAQVSVNVTP